MVTSVKEANLWPPLDSCLPVPSALGNNNSRSNSNNNNSNANNVTNKLAIAASFQGECFIYSYYWDLKIKSKTTSLLWFLRKRKARAYLLIRKKKIRWERRSLPLPALTLSPLGELLRGPRLLPERFLSGASEHPQAANCQLRNVWEVLCKRWKKRSLTNNKR